MSEPLLKFDAGSSILRPKSSDRNTSVEENGLPETKKVFEATEMSKHSWMGHVYKFSQAGVGTAVGGDYVYS